MKENKNLPTQIRNLYKMYLAFCKDADFVEHIQFRHEELDEARKINKKSIHIVYPQESHIVNILQKGFSEVNMIEVQEFRISDCSDDFYKYHIWIKKEHILNFSIFEFIKNFSEKNI